MQRAASRLCRLSLLATIATVPGSLRSTPAHPDFSGIWSLDVSKSEGSSLPTSASLKVTQGDKLMTLERTESQNGATGRVTDTYMLDGSPSKNTRTAFGTTIDFNSVAAWNEDTLVITTSWTFDGRSFVATDLYSLSGNKKLLIIAKQALINGVTLSMRQVYAKQ